MPRYGYAITDRRLQQDERGYGGRGRIEVMAKLLERVERFLSARGEATQPLHSTSNPLQPTSSGARAEASAGAGAEGLERQQQKGQERENAVGHNCLDVDVMLR